MEELSEKSGYHLTEANPEEHDAVLRREKAYATWKEERKAAALTAKEADAAIENRLNRLAELSEEELPAALSAFVAFELPVLCNRACGEDEEGARVLCNRISTNLLLNGPSQKYDDVERWITVNGQHIPIRNGQSEEEAIHEHQHWRESAGSGEKNKRQNSGMKWHAQQKKKAQNPSEKSSQKPEKNAILKGQNEPAKTSEVSVHRLLPKEKQGNQEGLGEHVRHELGRVSRANAEAGIPEYDIEHHYNSQVAALKKLRSSNPEFATTAKGDVEGNEHLVEFRGERVLKHTFDNGKNPEVHSHFGFRVDSQYDMEGTGGYKGSLILRPATPQEYIDRIDAQNAVFDSDLRPEGIHEYKGHIGLTVSQKSIRAF